MDETKTYEEPKPAAEAEEAPAAAEAAPSEGKPEKARKAKREVCFGRPFCFSRR